MLVLDKLYCTYKVFCLISTCVVFYYTSNHVIPTTMFEVSFYIIVIFKIHTCLTVSGSFRENGFYPEEMFVTTQNCFMFTCMLFNV